jgi:hypothetical protein
MANAMMKKPVKSISLMVAKALCACIDYRGIFRKKLQELLQVTRFSLVIAGKTLRGFESRSSGRRVPRGKSQGLRRHDGDNERVSSSAKNHLAQLPQSSSPALSQSRCLSRNSSSTGTTVLMSRESIFWPATASASPGSQSGIGKGAKVTSQMRAVPSDEAVTTDLPSGLNSAYWTRPLCRSGSLTGWPLATSQIRPLLS